MEVTKIKKRGNSLVAFNENGDSMATLSIKTEKFCGNTDALIPLTKALETYKQKE